MEYYCSLQDKNCKLLEDHVDDNLEDHDVAMSSDTLHVVRMFLLK
jgi:hypothetical protein